MPGYPKTQQQPSPIAVPQHYVVQVSGGGG
jgi:hypothetical protein